MQCSEERVFDESMELEPAFYIMPDFDPYYEDEKENEKENHVDIKKLLIDLGSQPHTKTLFRDSVINQMMSVLISESKPNVILAGMPGTGKTKIAEELAYRIKTEDSSVPEQLKGYTIYMLNLSDIVSGCGLVGDLEKKMQKLIEFLEDEQNKVIVFIDEIHMLFSNETYIKMAQILKPSLSRGKIKTIGATTIQEIGVIDADPAFNRRFTRLLVDELTKEQTREVVNSYTSVLEKHYGVNIQVPDGLCEVIIRIADEFLAGSAGSHRPDNALTLLDRCVGECVVKKMISSNREIVLSEKLVENTAFFMVSGNSEMHGFDENEFRKQLSVIKGQDEIIRDISHILKIHDLHIHSNNKPLTFLFAGGSGVGKTEISKTIAHQYFKEKPIILNMTEFHDSASINRIIGAPAGYVGCDNGELPFDVLDTNPYQLILLDEFEKACRPVQRLFMSVFDEGILKTSRGKMIDFSKSIVIATTNAGYTKNTKPMGFAPDEKFNNKLSVVLLSQYFDVELINRFEIIYTFNSISENIYAEILKCTYQSEVTRLKKHFNKVEQIKELKEELSEDEVRELVAKSYHSQLGARPVRKVVQKYIDNIILCGT